MEEPTSLILYIIDFIKENQHLYDTINLLVSKENKKLNSQLININIKKVPSFIDDYYIEEIQLSNSKTKNTSGIFYFPVYVNQNNILCAQIDVKENFCFEIIYYNNNKENLPKLFNFMNKKNKKIIINRYDKFGIPNVVRFSFLNINKKQLNIKETNIHLSKSKNSGSYLISDFTIDNYHEIRIHRRRKEIYKFLDKNSYNIDNFFKNCLEIYDYFNDNLADGNALKLINNKINFDYNLFSDKILNIRHYAKYIHDIPTLTEKEYKCCVVYGIIEIMKNMELTSIAWDFFLMSKEILKQTNLNFERKINLLFGFLRKCHERDIKITDCEIVNFHNIKKNSAYFKAHQFVKNIMENISINSKLFKFFYLCNSGSGSNRVLKEQSTFKLSMISEKIIKSHIKKLLPDACFRFFCRDSHLYGVTFTEDRVAFLNEGTLFKKPKQELEDLLLNNEDKNYEYTMPLVMIILHEYYGHSKNAYHYKKVNSPNYLNSNETFSFSEDLTNESITKSLKVKQYSLCDNGECGRTLEFFISSNKIIIYTLKFSYINMYDLFDVNLWVDINFNKLNEMVIKKIKDNNLVFEENEIKKSLPGFPEENDSFEIVKFGEPILYCSDESYDSDDFKYAKIEKKRKKIYFRDWKE